MQERISTYRTESGGRSRAGRSLRFLTRNARSGARTDGADQTPPASGLGLELAPDLPALDGRGIRDLLAQTQAFGGLVHFFEAGSASFGDWGEVLLRDPAVAAAALLQNSAQEEDRPALLEHLLALARSLFPEGTPPPDGPDPEHRRLIEYLLSDERRKAVFARTDRMIRAELEWQNAWAGRLERAGRACRHPLYAGTGEERRDSVFSNSLPGFLERDFPGYARMFRELGAEAGRKRLQPGAAPVGERDAVLAALRRIFALSDTDHADGPGEAGPGAAEAGQERGALPPTEYQRVFSGLRELVLLLGLRRSSLLRHARAVLDELLENPEGRLRPHIGLLLSFLRLYAVLQRDQNFLPYAHADHFYRRVLGFKPAPARPDRVLLSLRSEEGAPFFSLPGGTAVLADNPRGGPELEFATLQAAPVNPARLTEILSVAPLCGADGPQPGPWCRVGDYSELAAGGGDEAGRDDGAGLPRMRDLWTRTRREGELRVCPTLISLPDFDLAGGGRWLELRFVLAEEGSGAGLPRLEDGAALPRRADGRSASDAEAGHITALRQAWERLGGLERQAAPHRADPGTGVLSAEFSVAEGWIVPENCRWEMLFPRDTNEAEAEAGASATGVARPTPSWPDGESGLPGNALALNEPAASSLLSPTSPTSPTSSVAPELVLRLRLGAGQPALASPRPEAHGLSADCPVLRLSPETGEGGAPLRPVADFWRALAAFRVVSVRSALKVRGLRDFLVGSGGSLIPNPRDTGFEPFGGAPGPSAAFILEAPELLNKRVSRLRARWDWDAPESFAEYFQSYPFAPIRLVPAWRANRGEWREEPRRNGENAPETDQGVELGGAAVTNLDYVFPEGAPAGPEVGPGEADAEPESGVHVGFTGLRWRLSSGGSLFGHQDYPALQAKAALNESTLARRAFTFLSRDLNLCKLNPPFTPVWRELSLDYDARAEYAAEDLRRRLTHAHPFKPVAAARAAARAADGAENSASGLDIWEKPGRWPGDENAVAEANEPPRLFAHYDQYSLVLGFSVPEMTLALENSGGGGQRAAGSPLSLYFRLQGKAAGTGRRELPLLWGGTLLSDETGALRESGLLRVLPGEAGKASTGRSELPGLIHWPPPPGDAPHFRLRLGWKAEPDFALRNILENAVWAEYRGPAGSSGPGLGSGSAEADEAPRPFPLPQGCLNRLKPRPPEERAGLVTRYLVTLQIEQPYPSVGGRAAAPAAEEIYAGLETTVRPDGTEEPAGTLAALGAGESAAALAEFWQASAESLSHREQAILPRDFERIALRDYPEVMAAVCLPHCAGDAGREAPGQVSLAVFAPQEGAKIRQAAGGFALDPSLPAYADAALLRRLHTDLRGRSSPFAALHLLQPHYQALSLRLSGHCDPWRNIGQAEEELALAVHRRVAPWAFSPEAARFGADLDLDALLERIRDLPWLIRLSRCELRVEGAGGEELGRFDLLDGAGRAAPLPAPRPYGFFYLRELDIDLSTPGGKA